MNDTFTKQEIEFLQSKGLISHIAKQIPSPRAQKPGSHVSRKYVGDVLTGKIGNDSETAEKVEHYARIYLQIANTSKI